MPKGVNANSDRLRQLAVPMPLRGAQGLEIRRRRSSLKAIPFLDANPAIFQTRIKTEKEESRRCIRNRAGPFKNLSISPCGVSARCLNQNKFQHLLLHFGRRSICQTRTKRQRQSSRTNRQFVFSFHLAISTFRVSHLFTSREVQGGESPSSRKDPS